jgi:hypothetical protein
MSAPVISAPERPRPDHLHPDDEALAQYSSVSRMAVLSVALGLVSALALVSPILVVVPLAAIATAVIALRQIALSQGRLMGTRPATVGLCLATLFLGWGLSREVTRNAVLTRQAQEFADGWLVLVRQGKLQRADQMTRPASSRLNGDEAIAEFYASDQEAGDTMKQMFSSEPLQSFVAQGSAATFQFQSVVERSSYGFLDNIVLQYSLSTSADGKQAPLWISVERAGGPGGPPGWRIGRAQGDPPAGATP